MCSTARAATRRPERASNCRRRPNPPSTPSPHDPLSRMDAACSRWAIRVSCVRGLAGCGGGLWRATRGGQEPRVGSDCEEAEVYCHVASCAARRAHLRTARHSRGGATMACVLLSVSKLGWRLSAPALLEGGAGECGGARPREARGRARAEMPRLRFDCFESFVSEVCVCDCAVPA